MAKVDITFTAKNLKWLENQIGKIDGRTIREPLLKITREQIRLAAKEVKDQFNPSKASVGWDNEELVGKLGIGLGGRPLTAKMNTAWAWLVPASVDDLKGSFGKGAVFGRVRYIIDLSEKEGSFYNNFDTTYMATSRGNHDLIPWMQIYIDGMDRFYGFMYVERGDPLFRPNSSRTGIGHMIGGRGGSFNFPGVGRNKTFEVLLTAIKERFNNAGVKGAITKIIKRGMV